jgi:hypothetical protein
MKNFWILDGIAAVIGIDRKNNSSIVDDVGKMLAGDSVHLTGSGYGCVAKTVKAVFDGLVTGTLKKSDTSPATNVSGGSQHRLHRPQSFYWRGFESPVGCDRAANINCAMKRSGSGGKFRHHPYQRN